ncbi:aldose epimerase family protein [Paracoccus aestuariivivens]|uniref:Galactose mutarotase n=1 Tax=Paracoccus aestuariivivens TaxID=1820333 RepID=A0A6L6JAN9_9RHOB|nr:aldose epimerase family protein [Paracoccus aestuariivivens]MTH78188.1 galactose mutarotase [Paracoccus aestuariivivens]
MTREEFGTLPDGQKVERITISAHGLTLSLLTLGASVQDLRLDGVDHPLVLGFPTLAPYLDEGRYFGAIVGRCANRVARGEALVEGKILTLDRNERDLTMLHGGSDGTGVRNWAVGEITEDAVALSDYLPDGHMGFPGAMLVHVRYRLLPDATLQIDMLVTASETTVCNFAQHTYFNLDGSHSIADHRLTVLAESYLPVDADLIPLGPTAPVQGSHLDFRTATRLGDRLDGPLIDHNLCVADRKQTLPQPVATLEAGDLRLRIASTEPGLQVYAADHMRPGAIGTGGMPYGQHAGIALESQLWPDAVHNPGYPSAILPLGQLYRQSTILSFTHKTKS